MEQLALDFDPDSGVKPLYPGEPDALKILREINGYMTADPHQHLPGFGRAQGRRLDDVRVVDLLRVLSGARSKHERAARARSAGRAGRAPQVGLGVAGEPPRDVQPRLGGFEGNPWSERKRWVWWDPAFVNPPDPKTGVAPPRGKWVGYDVARLSPRTKAPDAQPKPDGIGLDALSGTQPFIMRADGKGWLFVPAGLVDGPLPTHYEPHESPVQNLLYPNTR